MANIIDKLERSGRAWPLPASTRGSVGGALAASLQKNALDANSEVTRLRAQIADLEAVISYWSLGHAQSGSCACLGCRRLGQEWIRLQRALRQ